MHQTSGAFDSDPVPWTRQRISAFRSYPRRKACLALVDRATSSALQEIFCELTGMNVWAMKFCLKACIFTGRQP